jgi:hypothetical protein
MGPFTASEKKATAWQPTFPSTVSRSKSKPVRNANALPLAGESLTASQQIPRLNYGRGAELRARFFCLEPGWLRGVITDLFNILDSVRLALPRSPNLESKYQRV